MSTNPRPPMRKRPAAPAAEPAAPSPIIDTSSDMLLAADMIFNGSTNIVKLSSGKPAIISQAKMKQVPQVIRFFNALTKGIDPSILIPIIEMYSERQRQLMRQRIDPTVVVEELDVNKLVRGAFDAAGLMTQVMTAAASELPALVASMTNLTAEEFDNLSPDEGMLVAGGIFMQNYSFFTRNLLPMLTAFASSWAGRMQDGPVAAAARGSTPQPQS